MVAAAALGRQRYETTERMIRQRAIERLSYQRHTGRANKSESWTGLIRLSVFLSAQTLNARPWWAAVARRAAS